MSDDRMHHALLDALEVSARSAALDPDGREALAALREELAEPDYEMLTRVRARLALRREVTGRPR
jgi:hypothetical protein